MLSISFSGVVWTAVNLLVLYVLMKKFLFGPVTQILDRRQQEIEDNMSAAQAQRVQAEQARAQYDEKLAQAQSEAAQLAAQAKQRGELAYASALSAAQADAQALMERTRAQLDEQRREMLQGARREVASLALLAAAKVAGKELDADADRALVDALLERQAGDGQ